MQSPTDRRFKAICAAFCERHGMAWTTFGAAFGDDSNLLKRLGEGASVTLPTFDKVLARIRAFEAGELEVEYRRRRPGVPVLPKNWPADEADAADDAPEAA